MLGANPPTEHAVRGCPFGYMAFEVHKYSIVPWPASRPTRDDSRSWVLFLAASELAMALLHGVADAPSPIGRGTFCSLSRRTCAAGQPFLGLDILSRSKAGLRGWGRTGVYLRSYSDPSVVEAPEPSNPVSQHARGSLEKHRPMVHVPERHVRKQYPSA